jgi:hypothetical protein
MLIAKEMDYLLKTNIVFLFISFACPKETNQRKGQSPKCNSLTKKDLTALTTSLHYKLAPSLNPATGRILNARPPFFGSLISSSSSG